MSEASPPDALSPSPPQEPRVDSVLLYGVVNIRVQLENRTLTDPKEAMEQAMESVELHDLFRRQRGLPRNISYTEWGESFGGALIDFQDDPEYEHSCYLASGEASQMLENPVVEALDEILSQGSAPLAALQAVAASQDFRLRRAACQGVILHPQAPRSAIQEAAERLCREDAYVALEWLEKNGAARARLRPEDLVPLFTHSDSTYRERAMRLFSTSFASAPPSPPSRTRRPR